MFKQVFVLDCFQRVSRGKAFNKKEREEGKKKTNAPTITSALQKQQTYMHWQVVHRQRRIIDRLFIISLFSSATERV